MQAFYIGSSARKVEPANNSAQESSAGRGFPRKESASHMQEDMCPRKANKDVFIVNSMDCNRPQG